MKDDVALRIKECLNDPNNKKTVNDIIVKMGRVLEKKRALQNEQPVLVFENRIWIGNFSYANNREFLQMNEIKTVISCLQMSLSLYLPDITYQRFDLKDSDDDRFDEIVTKFIDFLEKVQGTIYIHCFSGRSRSSALLLAYIMYKQSKTYDQTVQYLKKAYPIASPNSYFQSALRKMVFKPIQTKNLLDENFDQIPTSPRREIKSPTVQSPNKQQINLLQIKQSDNLEQKPQLNLLQQTIPPLSEESNLINIENTRDNSINIFSIQKQEDKPNIISNVQLLDLNQQSQAIPQQIETKQQLVQIATQKIETVQDNLIDFETQPPQKQTQTISQAKTEQVNLLQELTQSKKVQKEQSFADNTDFTQKKVKKNKKKR